MIPGLYCASAVLSGTASAQDPPGPLLAVAADIDANLTATSLLPRGPAVRSCDTMGLKNGGRAILSTPGGEARVRIYAYEGIMPGLVAMPRGLGHTANDRFLAGKGVNVNSLMGPVEDPATGYNAVWGIRAKLTKA